MLHVSVLRSECYGNLNNRDSIDLASIDHIYQFCTNVIIYCQTYFSDYLNNHLNYVTLIFNFPSQYNSYQIHQYSSTTWLKVAPYTSGKIWSARLIFFFFGSVFEYIHCNKYQNFNKFQPTDSELEITSFTVNVFRWRLNKHPFNYTSPIYNNFHWRLQREEKYNQGRITTINVLQSNLSKG
jgi:hypothetical protein